MDGSGFTGFLSSIESGSYREAQGREVIWVTSRLSPSSLILEPCPLLCTGASKGGGTANELRAENLEVEKIPRVLI